MGELSARAEDFLKLCEGIKITGDAPDIIKELLEEQRLLVDALRAYKLYDDHIHDIDGFKHVAVHFPNGCEVGCWERSTLWAKAREKMASRLRNYRLS